MTVLKKCFLVISCHACFTVTGRYAIIKLSFDKNIESYFLKAVFIDSFIIINFITAHCI